MGEALDPTAEQKAERLARLAADRAAELATADAEKATRLAVDRAVKDANVDRDLREHGQHLREINGSQAKMAASLQAVEDTLEEMNTSAQAVAKYIADQAGSRLSRRSLWIAALGVAAAYATIIALLITNGR